MQNAIFVMLVLCYENKHYELNYNPSWVFSMWSLHHLLCTFPGSSYSFEA